MVEPLGCPSSRQTHLLPKRKGNAQGITSNSLRKTTASESSSSTAAKLPRKQPKKASNSASITLTTITISTPPKDLKVTPIHITTKYPGESLTSAKLPGSTDHCIIAVGSDAERKDWSLAIQIAIDKAGDEEVKSDDDLSPRSSADILPRTEPMPRNGSELRPADTIPRSYSEMELPPSEKSFLEEEETEISEELTDDEEPSEIKFDKSESKSEPLTPKSGSRKSSIDLVKSDPTPRLESKSETPPTPSPPKTLEEISTTTTTITPSGTIKKEVTTTTTYADELLPVTPLAEEEDVTNKPLLSHVHYYKEGILQLKTLKNWKEYYFIVKNGLLLYYENERVTPMGVTYI
jgi:hypothetical protein